MHTSIGKLLAGINPETHSVIDNLYNSQEAAEQSRRDIIQMLDGVPHYVADAKIQKLAEGKPAHQTMAAMAKAGIRQLPYDPILIELSTRDVMDNGIHNFVRLQTKPIQGDAYGLTTPSGEEVKVAVYAYIVQWRDDPREAKRENILIASLPLEVPIGIQFNEDASADRPFIVLVQNHVLEMRERGDLAGLMEYEMHLVVAEAMAIAMLMLNTRGIEHLKVDTAKLNRARLRNSTPDRPKRPINPYTVLRIGHVYDAQGNAHSVTGSGRHMPVHWRAGHVRNVPYGTVRADVRPTRLRYIPPCLVNFDPLNPTTAPTPKHEVTV